MMSNMGEMVRCRTGVERQEGEQTSAHGETMGHTESDGEGQSKQQSRWRKLDIPIFSGDEAYGWTARLERYFRLKEVSEEEKMQAVVVALEGRALNWFQWWENCNPRPTWAMFKVAVVRRFQPMMMKDPFEILIGLRQEGTVGEYIEQFEKYVGSMKGMEEHYLVSIFFNGLKDDLHAEVKLYDPQTLVELMTKVQQIEDKDIAKAKGGGSNGTVKRDGFSRTFSGTRSYSNDSGVKGGGNLPPYVPPRGRSESLETVSGGGSNITGTSRNRGAGFKRLTQDEMQDKIRKGLCFRCDERFGPAHVFKNKQLRVMLLEDDELEESLEEEVAENKRSEEQQEVSLFQLSLMSIAGLTTKKSWKVRGLISSTEVILLVDCGASHNFVSAALARLKEWDIEDTDPFVVEVGDGHRVSCRGVCRGLTVRVQGVQIQQDFYLFELRGLDMVLGLEWLSGLGEVKIDFGKMILEFGEEGNRQVIRGEAGMLRSAVSFKSLLKAGREETVGCWLQLSVQLENSPTEKVLPAVQLVLKEFEEVFKDPVGLPPNRYHDHAIQLKPDSNIPNLRPYRYPYYQKDEIERLVMEMLQAEII